MKLLTKSVVVATVLCFVAGLSAGAAVSSYSPGAGDLFAGENLLALPVVPTDLDGSGRGPGYPEFILSPIDVSGANLQRWDTASQAWLSRSSASFGNLLSSEGYKLTAADSTPFSFNGANDLQQTDYWISLPKTGTTVVGNPYLYSVDWTKISVTNGMETVSIDAAINTKAWLTGVVGMDNYYKSDVAIGPVSSMPGIGANTSELIATKLEPWRGYKVTSLVDNLALIVTARKATDSVFSIKGIITLQDHSNPSAVPVIVELRNSDGSAKLARTIKHVGSAGEYTLDGVAPGTYSVAFKGTTFLAGVVTGVTVSSADVTGVDVSLLNGDVNGDNFIEESDFGAISEDWYTASLPTRGTDLNGDGFVEESDFGILSTNWYQGGDGAW